MRTRHTNVQEIALGSVLPDVNAWFKEQVDIATKQGLTPEDFAKSKMLNALKVITELKAKYVWGAVKIGFAQATSGVWTLVFGPLRSAFSGYQMIGRSIDGFEKSAYPCVMGTAGKDNACASPYRSDFFGKPKPFSWADFVQMAEELSKNIDLATNAAYDSTALVLALKAIRDADKTLGNPGEWPIWAKAIVGVVATAGTLYALGKVAEIKMAFSGVDGTSRGRKRRRRLRRARA